MEASPAVVRCLRRLATPNAVLARIGASRRYGVFASGDRRRRPSARVSSEEAAALLAEGALAPTDGDDAYVLSEAGRMRVRREAAAPGEGFAAQHAEMVERAAVGAGGSMRAVRGYRGSEALDRLAGLRDGAGRAWLSAGELAAARGLRLDWEAAQIGLVRGSDWRAAPKGSTRRGPQSGAESALAGACDARRRLDDALRALAPQLRRVVEQVLLSEQGFEAVERAEQWPARSARVALKLGLAQLAQARRR